MTATRTILFVSLLLAVTLIAGCSRQLAVTSGQGTGSENRIAQSPWYEIGIADIDWPY